MDRLFCFLNRFEQLKQNGEEPSREPVINERNIVWLMSFPNSVCTSSTEFTIH